MTGYAEHNTAFKFILLTFAVTMHQGQGQKRTCNLFSRPHPNGLCGHKLALAHENLCFLIRQNYPQFFPLSKRFLSREVSSVEDLAVPMPKYLDESAAVLGRGQELLPDVSTTLTGMNEQATALQPPAGQPGSIPEDVTVSAFLHLLAKRSSHTKRSLVCECCYGPCSTRTLARYC